MKSKFLVVFIMLFLLAGFSSAASAATVKIGALNDTTGATSDVGKDYALGIAEAIHYVNDAGGVNGKKIKLYQFDYGYRIPEALTKYKLFKRLKVAAVLSDHYQGQDSVCVCFLLGPSNRPCKDTLQSFLCNGLFNQCPGGNHGLV
jgi:hypothetical protein